MYYVYALKSISHNNIYVGMTSNLQERIKRHSSGWEKTTKFYRPFNLIYSEECTNGADAKKKEKYYKSGIGKKFLFNLITSKTELFQRNPPE